MIPRRHFLELGLGASPFVALRAPFVTPTVTPYVASKEASVLIQQLTEGARLDEKNPNWTGRDYTLYILADEDNLPRGAPGSYYYLNAISFPFLRIGPLVRGELVRVWQIAQGITNGIPSCPIRAGYPGSFNLRFLNCEQRTLIPWANRIAELVLQQDSLYRQVAASLPQPGQQSVF